MANFKNLVIEMTVSVKADKFTEKGGKSADGTRGASACIIDSMDVTASVSVKADEVDNVNCSDLGKMVGAAVRKQLDQKFNDLREEAEKSEEVQLKQYQKPVPTSMVPEKRPIGFRKEVAKKCDVG